MVWIKICGITSEEDALLAVAMGADALGFMFVPGSKRLVSVQQVTDIVKRLDPEVLTIGVFRDELAERVVDIVSRTGLGGAQLHGHETSETAAYVAARVGFSAQVFGAGDDALARARSYPVTAIMMDNPRGGSGMVFDWSLTDGVPSGRRWVLAGGLNPENIADALARTRPWGVDLSTGVESSPGVKDPRKLRAFIKAARTAARDLDLDAQWHSFALDAQDSTVDGDPPYDWADE